MCGRAGVLFAVALIAALVVSGVTSALARHHAVFLKIQHHGLVTRPLRIYPSPTNGPFAIHLNDWRHWGAARTHSTGTTYYDTCRPDCASGYHHTPGEAILSDRSRCGKQRHYRLLRFRYFGKPQHHAKIRFDCRGRPIKVNIT